MSLNWSTTEVKGNVKSSFWKVKRNRKRFNVKSQNRYCHIWNIIWHLWDFISLLSLNTCTLSNVHYPQRSIFLYIPARQKRWCKQMWCLFMSLFSTLYTHACTPICIPQKPRGGRDVYLTVTVSSSCELIDLKSYTTWYGWFKEFEEIHILVRMDTQANKMQHACVLHGRVTPFAPTIAT